MGETEGKAWAYPELGVCLVFVDDDMAGEAPQSFLRKIEQTGDGGSCECKSSLGAWLVGRRGAGKAMMTAQLLWIYGVRFAQEAFMKDM